MRDVRLALCTPDGEVLGSLPRFEVDTPWWQDIAPAVAHVRAHFGIGVTVLRLLETDGRWPPHGGPVTYLAETHDRPPGLEPADVDMSDHPLRMRWARPGGVDAIVGWADQFVTRIGPAEQQRTWNLSLVMTLPTDDGPVWLKATPPFFAHEGRVLEHMQDIGPPLIAYDEGVVLLRDVDGEDRYGAPEAWMVDRWVDVQAEWSTSIAGLPDWTASSFMDGVEQLDAPQELIGELPARFELLDGCDLPDTIVHGDFHAGNWRGETLLDWGDSGIGHPLLDQPAFGDVNAPWESAWKRHRPRADVARAIDVIAPIAALRQALIYQTFLDNIEPSEHCYHRNDPEEWIRKAVERRSRYSV
jgi:hypothetical protein